MIFMYVFKEILILRDYHLSKSIYRLNLSIIDIPTLLHTWMIMCVTTKLQMVPYNLYHKSVIINFWFNDPLISEIPEWVCFEMKTYNLLLEFGKTKK